MTIYSLSNLRPGQIGFSGGNSLIQKGIRFFGESRFSHISRKLMENDYIEVYELTQNNQVIQNNAIIKTYSEYSGMRFGYESWLWFLYKYIFRSKVQIPKMFTRGVTCTELTAFYLKNSGINYSTLINNVVSDYRPAELEQIVKNNPLKFNKVWENAL